MTYAKIKPSWLLLMGGNYFPIPPLLGQKFLDSGDFKSIEDKYPNVIVYDPTPINN